MLEEDSLDTNQSNKQSVSQSDKRTIELFIYTEQYPTEVPSTPLCCHTGQFSDVSVFLAEWHLAVRAG